MTQKSSRTPPSGPSAGVDPNDRRREILETAARLICENGYDGTSLRDIAEACGLTKAGLYHHCKSKDHLLFEIMNYGMDVFEERVLSRVMPIVDPVERLRTCMRLNVRLVTDDPTKEVTIILHEHATLRGDARGLINARKKRYVNFLESSFAEAIRDGRLRGVHPRVAAFSFLGQVLWIYKWFRSDGAIEGDQLATEMEKLFFEGLEIPPAAAEPPAREERVH